MYNYKIVLQYDGGRYDGWQRLGRDGSSNTIEAKIKDIISRMTGEEIDIYCGSRTEKGVHAFEQTANFKLNTRQKDYELRNYLNRYLPRDIAVLGVEAADERFHSQLNARARVYEYRLDTADIADVFNRRYCYHTFEKPDFNAMRKAAEYFVGEHDFKAFTTARKSKSTVKRIDNIDILYNEKNQKAAIRITANDFLHNMARLMTGMLIDVGNGIKKPEDVKKVLDGEDIQMSLPAEPHALFLKKVIY